MFGRSSLTLFATVALLATGFAGCLEAAPSFLAATDGEVSAMTHLDLADAAANAWHGNASLVSVFTLELSEMDDEVPADPSVGNGRAPQWWYAYRSDEGEYAAWRVTSDGQVRRENESILEGYDLEYDDEEVLALSDWNIDSDAAIGAAREDDMFASVVDAENASLAEGVAAMDNMTGWYFAAWSPAGFVVAIVDGATGELVSVESMDFDFDFDMPDFGWPAPVVEIDAEGALDGEENWVEWTFSLDEGGLPASLNLETEKRLPSDGLHWMIIDADGEVLHDGHVGEMWTERDATMEEFTIEDAGDYTLALEYMPFPPDDLMALGEVDYELEFVVGLTWDASVDVDWTP